MTIGENVRRLRRAAGLSQLALGGQLGVHQSTIAYWENVPGWSPSAANVADLCRVFSCTPDDLFGVMEEKE